MVLVVVVVVLDLVIAVEHGLIAGAELRVLVVVPTAWPRRRRRRHGTLLLLPTLAVALRCRPRRASLRRARVPLAARGPTAKHCLLGIVHVGVVVENVLVVAVAQQPTRIVVVHVGGVVVLLQLLVLARNLHLLLKRVDALVPAHAHGCRRPTVQRVLGIALLS